MEVDAPAHPGLGAMALPAEAVVLLAEVVVLLVEVVVGEPRLAHRARTAAATPTKRIRR